GVTHTLADVKDQVRDKLATDKARNDLQNKRDEIEDERLAGRTLKEIANNLKIGFEEIPAADPEGMGPDGKPVMKTPDLRKIMARAFAPDSNDDTPVDLSDDGFAWVNVLSTDAPKQKPYDEVKEDVKKNYMSSERQRLIDELAKKMADKVNSGAPMTSLE